MSRAAFDDEGSIVGVTQFAYPDEKPEFKEDPPPAWIADGCIEIEIFYSAMKLCDNLARWFRTKRAAGYGNCARCTYASGPRA